MKHSSSLLSRCAQRGLTLIELLVAMVIGLVVVLAVTSIVTLGESQKRSTTSTNDMNQSGTYAAYAIDRLLRSAGSGFAQSGSARFKPAGAPELFGCRLSAARNIGGAPTTILPRATAFPAPFQNFLGGAGAAAAGNLRMAPLLIAKNQSAAGSDVLMVMGGNAAAGDAPRQIRSGVAGNDNLRLDNTIGLVDADVGLVTQAGITDCLIEQVNAPDAAARAALVAAGNEILPIGGKYLTASGSTTSLATLAGSGSAYFIPLGNANASNMQFQLLGVGDNRTLFSYDLLRAAGSGTDVDAMQAVADGVVALFAMYGVDTNDDRIVDAWVDPAAAGYTIADMQTAAGAPDAVRRIVAARVAIVLRSSLYEKDAVTAAGNLVVFGDQAAGLQRTVTVNNADDVHYRYRVIDTIVPLRNMMLLPTP
jgi:type IV pilus assembly protein PilW